MDSSVTVDTTTVRLLDAAALCFAERGVRRTTMSQIADRAAVGVATAYRRFPRKAALVRAVILREAERLTAAVAREMERPVTVEEQSAGGFTAFAHALAERQWLVDLLRGTGADAGVMGAEGVLLDQVMTMARDYVSGWLRTYQAKGRFIDLDPDIVGEIYARLGLSLVLAPNGAIPMHDDDATRAFAKMYLVPLLGRDAFDPIAAQA